MPPHFSLLCVTPHVQHISESALDLATLVAEVQDLNRQQADVACLDIGGVDRLPLIFR